MSVDSEQLDSTSSDSVVVVRWLFYFLWFVCVVVFLWFTVRIFCQRRSTRAVKRGGHYWRQFADQPRHCSWCRHYCVDDGRRCDACGACVCLKRACLHSASRSLECKKRTSLGSRMTHHWVHGNVPLLSTCQICYTACGDAPRLVDYRCAWCGIVVHEECWNERKDLVDQVCGLGPHSSLIIPPNCVVMRREGWRTRRRMVVNELKHPSHVENWRPMIVLANPKSGGKDGEMVIGLLRGLLNPIQVFDVSETVPEEALKICRLLPDVCFTVLICGGDGTVGWVLRTIEEANFQTLPHVGLLPLGTGNDLARVLGWGSGYTGGEEEEELTKVLQALQSAKPHLLDRWEVKVLQSKRYLQFQKKSKKLAMSNYLGVGCDAGVTLMVHEQRETKPYLFTSRVINKLWFVIFGAKDVIQKSCSDLRNKIELYLDGERQDLPNLEGVVVLNINCWSSGCVMWPDTFSECDNKEKNLVPSRMDDQLLEVVGIYSSMHVGKIQVSVEKPLPIGQARAVTIVLHKNVPVQVDGEPWLQSPSTITISHLGHAHMLQNSAQS